MVGKKNTCVYSVKTYLGILDYLLNTTALHFSFGIIRNEKERKRSCVEFHN